MASHPVDRIVGTSPAIIALRQQIHHLAAFDVIGNPHVPTLLLQGETGTGKGLVARVVHDSGARAAGPFVDVNCSAIPEHLLEAELFGFEPGAFTDARRAKPGLLETASRGTLFLDEMDTLPLALQAKLLRSIEDKRVRRLGAVTDLPVDVKVVAASQAPLGQRVDEGRFRADLYHRLAVVVLDIPPLRERGNDALELARHFLRRYAAAHRLPERRLSGQAEAWLRAHPWPGNVRELGHLMERVTLLVAGSTIGAEALERLSLPALRPAAAPAVDVADGSGRGAEAADRRPLPRGDDAAIREAIVRAGGNIVQAARILGLSRNALRYRMLRYGIARPAGSHPGSGSGNVVPVIGEPEARGGEPGLVGAGGPAAAMPPDSSALWERRPVAVLVIELTFATAAGDMPASEPWTAARRWEVAVAEKVEGFGGILLQRSPSLYTAVFGVPRALDRMPQRALHAALALRHAIEEAASVSGVSPRATARFAAHLGEVLVDVNEPVPPGRLLAVADALALPVRLLGLAGAGEVVVSPGLRRILEREFALESRVLTAGSGDADRIAGLVVKGFAPSAPTGEPPLTRFVGRQRELAELERALELAGSGQGQVVAVVGDAGMGKSRLCAVFAERARQRCLVLEAAAPSPGRPHAFLPLIEMLKHMCGIDARDDAPARRRKLTERVRGVDDRLEEVLPYLLALLGQADPTSALPQMDPDLRRRRTLDAVKRLLLQQSVTRPALLIVEDLHWLDEDTLAFLDALVDGITGARLLLLVTYRPEHRHTWAGRSAYAQVRLDPLAPGEAQDLLGILVEDAPEPTSMILDKAQGNPFFIEEIVQALVDQGVLARDPADALAPARLTGARPATPFEVPATIQGVIAARVDRLPAAERALLQTLAVLGPAFPLTLVERIAGRPEAELRALLAPLQAAEFVHERTAMPEPSFAFKHTLTRDVAYASLAGERRRRLHVRTAEAIETLFADRLADHYDTLAHHYRQAGVTEQAVDYLKRAGQQAVQRSAYVEAIAGFTAALELLAPLPGTPERSQRELEVQTALGAALMAARGLGAPEVELVFTRARELCRQVGDTPQLFQVLQGLGVFYALRVKLRTVEELVEERRRLAERLGHRTLLLQAQIARGHILLALGDVASARAELERGMALYDAREHQTLTLGAGLDPSGRDHGALVLWLLGYPDAAGVSLRQAVTLAEAHRHPFNLVVARLFGAMLHQLRREPETTRVWAEAAGEIASQHASSGSGPREWTFPMWGAMGLALHGWALSMLGRPEGVSQVRHGIAEWRATGAELVRPYFLGLLAEAQMRAGQTDEALTTVGEALETASRTEERWWEAELLRLQGELLATSSAPRKMEAEDSLRAALDLAGRQQAKSLELRAATSLARLWQRRGRCRDARDLLAPIRAKLSEGVDTPDSKEAAALLAALGSS
jgi:DNA-binding NtrC family response regulator/predicted ATPase